MHRILERQIKRHLGELSMEDLSTEWREFLETVSKTYASADEDRKLLNRSLELSSEEFAELNEKLLSEKDLIEQEVRDRTKELRETLERQRELDAELTKANEELRELDNRKSEFISTAAHQLRTPVSGIKWAFEGLECGEFGELTEKQKKVIENGKQKSIELANIVDTLLHTASLEEGQVDISLEKIAVDKAISRCIEAVHLEATEKGIRIIFDEEAAQALPNICADREKIHWVIQNILDNAIRYTLEGGGEIEISVYQPDEGSVGVSVRDTGIGIPADEQKALFQRFYRGEKAKRMHNGGNGLGLYIVKDIVESHGGDIWVDSTPGEGTTISFTLPIDPPDSTRVSADAEK